MPLLFSTAACALRILDAATIFMAFVILPMFLMALMRCLTVERDQQSKKCSRKTQACCLGYC
jgi:hypothetical protein